MKQRYNNFINKSILKHGEYYDYSFVDYIDAKTPVKIICPKHGEFEQTPDNHSRGRGCSICGGSNKSTTNDFIKKAKEKHNDYYNYSKVDYVNNSTKVILICPKHGEFKQRPNDHLKYGCNKCGIEVIAKIKILNLNEFIIKAKNKHGDFYDYSKVIYNGHRNYVNIICPEHGEFKQKANGHLNGQGCPICKESKGEREIRLWLEVKNINYISQYRFNDCRNIRPLPFDFYLPYYNTCIEFDGEQHYRLQENSLFGDSEEFNKRQLHDLIKTNYCNGLFDRPKLIRIKYSEINQIDSILSNFFN